MVGEGPDSLHSWLTLFVQTPTAVRRSARGSRGHSLARGLNGAPPGVRTAKRAKARTARPFHRVPFTFRASDFKLQDTELNAYPVGVGPGWILCVKDCTLVQDPWEDVKFTALSGGYDSDKDRMRLVYSAHLPGLPGYTVTCSGTPSPVPGVPLPELNDALVFFHPWKSGDEITFRLSLTRPAGTLPLTPVE